MSEHLAGDVQDILRGLEYYPSRVRRASVRSARFPDATWPNVKAKSSWAVLEALLRNENLTVAVALERYQVYALSQECGRLRALGWPVQSKTVELPSGKRVSEYWI